MRWPITAPSPHPYAAPRIVRLGIVGAMLFILGATLIPMDAGSETDFIACIVCGSRGTADALVNVILFAPLGLALALTGRTGIRWIGYAALLSATIEFAQLVIPGRDPERQHAANFLFQKVKPGSKLWTDGAGIYRNIERWWPVKHQADIHRKWQFGKTSEIEGVFGNYRTFVRQMYHHHWSRNLEEYVREFCFRFSSPELFENPLFYLSKTLTLVTTC